MVAKGGVVSGPFAHRSETRGVFRHNYIMLFNMFNVEM